MFKNLENEYKIGQRKGDCEKYYWIVGDANIYPNATTSGAFFGTNNTRAFFGEPNILFGPPIVGGDYPFEFDVTFDIGAALDGGDLFDQYTSYVAPIDDAVLQIIHSVNSTLGGTGSQATIRENQTIRTERNSFVAAFKCPVEIFSARYFDPDANSAFISFVTASEKLCDICANISDTNLDNRIVLDEPNITFQDLPFNPSDNEVTDDREIVDFAELDSHDLDITITPEKKFFFMGEPVTQATIDAANFQNEIDTLWDDPNSIQPGLFSPPPPGSSFTAFGYIYTVQYKIEGTSRIVGRLNDPPSSQSAQVTTVDEWKETRPFRTEFEDIFIYDEDRADRLWNVNGFI